MRAFFNKKTWLPLLCLSIIGGLVACSDDGGDGDSSAPNKSPLQFKATLSAAEIPLIPALSSNANGSFNFSLNPDTHVLSGSVVLEGIVATNAHIHNGGVGRNGDVFVALLKDNVQNRFAIPDNTVLSADQEQALLDGLYYVNVHSQAYPTGELRGQILPQGSSVYVTELSTQELLSPVTSAGSARAFMTVDGNSGDVNAVLKLDGITATNAHIHDAYAGNNGGVVLALQQSSDPLLWEITMQSLTADQRAALNKGRYYFNVHTQTNASGELRGQILAPGVATNIVALQAVNGVITDASGVVYTTIDKNTGLLNVVVRTSGVAITAMHIHDSANSSVVVGLTQSSDASVWELVDKQLSETQVNELLLGHYYVNVHSAANQSGELSATVF